MPVSRRSRKVHGPVKELEMSRSVVAIEPQARGTPGS